MFTCPNCKNKNISFLEKWKANERKPRECSKCHFKYFLSPWKNAFLLTLNSFVWVGLIAYCIINFTWVSAIILMGGIGLLEILRVLVVPLVGPSDKRNK